MDMDHVMHRPQSQREDDTDEDHENGRAVANPECHQGKGDPGYRGDRSQQGDRREHEFAEDVDVEGETADEQGGDKRQ